MESTRPTFLLKFRNLSVSWKNKSFFQGEEEVIDLSKNPMLPILGPSGCGKSSLLFLLSAMKWPEQGEIEWQFPDGQKLTWTPTNKQRDYRKLNRLHRKYFGFAFQQSTLLPFFTIRENLAYPLKLLGMSERQIAEEIHKVMDCVILQGHNKDETHEYFLQKYPMELSGGQLQRMVLAQAMVKTPSVLFADEPTGNLDAENREHVMQSVQRWIAEGQGERVFIWVTHHKEEPAIYSDDRALAFLHKQHRKSPEKAISLVSNYSSIGQHYG